MIQETEHGRWGNNSGGGAIHDERDFSVKINFGEKLKSWLMAIAFVAAIAGNLLFGVLYLQAERKLTTTEDLKKYEFEYFKQTEWVDMKTNVEVTKQLIAAKCSK